MTIRSIYSYFLEVYVMSTKIYGYCRVSTKKQGTKNGIKRQIVNIQKEYPTAEFIKEIYTGSTQARPAWESLMKKVDKDTTIVMDSVSRMSRSAEQGFLDYKKLYELGVKLVFLKEPHINTDVFKASANNMIKISISSGNKAVDEYIKGNADLINKLILQLAEEQIKLAFQRAEAELLDIHNRISEGIRESKKAGKRIGMPKGSSYETKKAKMCKEIILKHSLTFGGTLSDLEVIKLCGCSQNSYYKYKSELKNKADY